MCPFCSQVLLGLQGFRNQIGTQKGTQLIATARLGVPRPLGRRLTGVFLRLLSSLKREEGVFFVDMCAGVLNEGSKMRLTPFGEAVRLLRMKYDISLKVMAEAMGISSAHLSGIEYGEKRLSDKHIKAAVGFFEPMANAVQISELRLAAERSKDVINTAALSPDARGLVAAFARRLQEGAAPTDEILNWVNERNVKRD